MLQRLHVFGTGKGHLKIELSQTKSQFGRCYVTEALDQQRSEQANGRHRQNIQFGHHPGLASHGAASNVTKNYKIHFIATCGYRYHQRQCAVRRADMLRCDYNVRHRYNGRGCIL
jgi:hypothetical protein